MRPSLRAAVESLSRDGADLPADFVQKVVNSIAEAGGFDAARAFARAETDAALKALDAVPDGYEVSESKNGLPVLKRSK